MWWLDRLAAEILAPLAAGVLASGLDDLFLDLAYIYLWFQARLRPGSGSVDGPPDPTDRAVRLDPLDPVPAYGSGAGSGGRKSGAEPAIAILVPCWQEAAVIEDMLDTNLTAIEYDNYEVWLGVYPNDPATIERVLACEARFRRIRHVVCPTDGPTTKADCLNVVFQQLRAHEAAAGRRYDVVVQHDAEDLIHPQSLRRAAEQCARFDMVQIPIFPLPTPLRRFTHGVYCDEFAEYHLKELYVRSRLGGFVPSAGVGTAYRRDALEKLFAAQGGQLFDPGSLTEDYFMGLELHRLGCSQTLLRAAEPRSEPSGGQPRTQHGGLGLVATRAYFPFRVRAAIRQRTRWVTGNALQSWSRFGWNAGPWQWYWLWRDRKGLAGAPASTLANLLFCYGLARWVWLTDSSVSAFQGWLASNRLLAGVLGANLLILLWRQLARVACCGRIYGWRQACCVPLRAPWSNLINFCATSRALASFTQANWLRRPLTWAKTSHAYPGRENLAGGGRRLGQILVSMQAASGAQVETALEGLQPGERIGECLVRGGQISEEQLYQALGLQSGLPFRRLALGAVDELARGFIDTALAFAAAAIPFQTASGKTLWLAVKDPPSPAARQRLSRACRLPLRFTLITASNFEELCAGLGRRPVPIDRPREIPATKERLRSFRPRLPAMEVRLSLPAWLAIHRRMSITLEYRRPV